MEDSVACGEMIHGGEKRRGEGKAPVPSQRGLGTNGEGIWRADKRTLCLVMVHPSLPEAPGRSEGFQVLVPA